MLDRKAIQTFLVRVAPFLCGGLYVALVIRAALAWAPALNPSALWHDDIWVAVLTRMDSVVEMLRVRIPIAPGYLLLSRIAGQTSTDPELPLQITAFATGLLCIPAIGFLVQRVTGNRWAGLLAAALTSANHCIGTYAIRVKPYTLDFLLTTVLLLIGHAAISKPSSRRVLALAVVAVIAAPFSFPSLIASVLLLLFAMLADIRMRRTDKPHSTRIIIYTISGLALLGCWFLLDMQSRSNPFLKAYLARHFTLQQAPGDAVRFALSSMMFMFNAAMPAFLRHIGWLAIPSLILMLLNKVTRVFGWFIACFYLTVLAANMLNMYPLGLARLLAFTFPVTLLLLCFGINRLSELLCLRKSWLAALAIVVCIAAFAKPVRPNYPGFDAPPPVAALEQAANVEDTILLHPAADRVVSYYGTWPIRFVLAPERLIGFTATIDRENVIYTKGTEAAIYEHVCGALEETPPTRVLYYGIDSIGGTEPGRMYKANATILNALANSGYVQETVIAEVPGTKVISFLRAETP